MSELFDQDIIYHYCSSSTFLSIIKHKKIWLTDLTLSNDSMEGLWAVKDYLNRFKHDDRRGRLAASAALESEISSRMALGSCFSSEGDLLSQWRGYASGGRGVCIGFRIDEMREIEGRPAAQLKKISYPSMITPDLVKGIWEEFKDQIEQGRQGQGQYISFTKSYEGGGHDRVTDLIRQLYTIKNPAFQEEQEWRLLYVDYPENIADLEFRENNGLLTPYIKLPISNEIISSVTLGPTHPTPERGVERLLSANGIRASVRKSSASYVTR